MLSQMVSPLRCLSNTDDEWQFMPKNYINFESYTPLMLGDKVIGFVETAPTFDEPYCVCRIWETEFSFDYKYTHSSCGQDHYDIASIRLKTE